MNEAIAEAHRGLAEGGVPVGALLVQNGQILGRGRNSVVQHGDPTAHAEMECLRDAGRQEQLSDAVLYTTMAPCIMCAGAIIRFGVSTVVVGESRTFGGAITLMKEHGVKVIDLDIEELTIMARRSLHEHPEIWSRPSSPG